MMRSEDGGKSRGKQPQWDEGRCLGFTLMHKTITSRAPRSPSICLSGKEKKTEKWRRKKEGEGGRSAGERASEVCYKKKKKNCAHPHGSEPSEIANQKRQ